MPTSKPVHVSFFLGLASISLVPYAISSVYLFAFKKQHSLGLKKNVNQQTKGITVGREIQREEQVDPDGNVKGQHDPRSKRATRAI